MMNSTLSLLRLAPAALPMRSLVQAVGAACGSSRALPTLGSRLFASQAASVNLHHVPDVAGPVTQLAGDSKPQVSTQVLNVPPRVKGWARKAVLRAVNKAIISRLARRATIGIPVLGMYFASRILYKDSCNALEKCRAGDTLSASLFGAAVGCTVLDLIAQSAVIHSVFTGAYGLPLPPMDLAHLSFGVAALSGVLAMVPAPDKVSLATAAGSAVFGLLAEAAGARKESQDEPTDDEQKHA